MLSSDTFSDLKKYWSCTIYSKNTGLARYTQKILLLHHILKKICSCTTHSKNTGLAPHTQKNTGLVLHTQKNTGLVSHTYIKRCRKGSCTLFLTLYRNQVECCSVIFVHNYLILVLQLEPN